MTLGPIYTMGEPRALEYIDSVSKLYTQSPQGANPEQLSHTQKSHCCPYTLRGTNMD